MSMGLRCGGAFFWTDSGLPQREVKIPTLAAKDAARMGHPQVLLGNNNYENYRGCTRRLAPGGGSVCGQLLNANREKAADFGAAIHL